MIIGGIVLVVVVLGVIYFIGSEQENTDCAEEGESIGSCIGCKKECCSGLKAMADLK